MAQDFGVPPTPIPPTQPVQSNSTRNIIIIVVIILAVLLICCCLAVVVGYGLLNISGSTFSQMISP